MLSSYRGVVVLFSTLILISCIRLALFAMPAQPLQQELTPAQMRQDLYALQQQIERHSAFYALDNAQNAQVFQRYANHIIEQYPHIISNDRFAAEITKLLNTIKDPAANVGPFDDKIGQLPIILRPLNEHWLALNHAHDPLDVNFPFITHIDGLPMAKWVNASQMYLPEPAKESQEMQLPWLSKLNLLRGDLGLSEKDTVLLTLSNDNFETKQLDVALDTFSANHRNTASTPPSDDPQALFTILTQYLDVNPAVNSTAQLTLINTTTARLSIEDLSDFETNKALQQQLLAGMHLPLLVIDLRRAHGFSPKLLTMLSRYQNVADNAHAHINKTGPRHADIMGFAHYRRSPEFRNDYLNPLNFMPLNEVVNNPSRLKALTRHLPQRDADKFSPWFVRTKPQVTPQGDNRLALLVSPHCRQECEWIAYRTKSWPRVNLIGERTSGDFARVYQFHLPNSGLAVSLSTSLAYDKDGKQLSGLGTEPDILLPQNSDIEWRGLASLVNTNTPKNQMASQIIPLKLAKLSARTEVPPQAAQR